MFVYERQIVIQKTNLTKSPTKTNTRQIFQRLVNHCIRNLIDRPNSVVILITISSIL